MIWTVQNHFGPLEGKGKKKRTTKTPSEIDGPIEEPGKKKPTTKTPAQIEPHEEGYASDTTITNVPISSEFGTKSSEKSSLSHEENSQISGTATELQSTSEIEPSQISLVSNSVSNFPTEEPPTDLTTASGAREPSSLELVSKELNHFAAFLHVYAGGLNFMKYKKKILLLFYRKKMEILLHFLSFL